MDNWKTEKLAETYLEGVRGAIPFANEQIDFLLRIINSFKPEVDISAILTPFSVMLTP